MPRRQPDYVYNRRRLAVLTLALLLIAAPTYVLTRSSAPADPAPVSAGPAGSDPPAAPQGCRAAVAGLSPRARLALLVMVGVDGDDVARVQELLTSPDRPGGIFVQSGTAVWEEQVFTSTDAALPLLVAVDDEGGRVQPLAGTLDDLAAAADRAELDAATISSAAQARGEQLRALGIDVVFAPVVDVGAGAGIGDRSFADDAEQVTAVAGAYAAGLRTAGILPVLKHFPGHGSASADSHVGRATTPPLAELRARDLKPYESLLGVDRVGVMVGHLDVPGLTEEGIPSSLSPDAIGLLRGAYEFAGPVFTDDLSAMRAVTERFSVPAAAELALVAGADVALLARDADVDAVLDRLTDAASTGRLSERRIDAAVERVVLASRCAETPAG